MNKEAIGIILILAGLIGSAVITGSMAWTISLVVLVMVLALEEGILVVIKKKTLSQLFGEMNMKKKIILSSGLGLFFIALLFHLWSM